MSDSNWGKFQLQQLLPTKNNNGSSASLSYKDTSTIASTLGEGKKSTYVMHGENDSETTSVRYGSFSSISDLEHVVEVPQGRHLGVFSTVVLFVSRIIGSGIFASSAVYVNSGGNLLIYFTVWFLAAVLAVCGLFLYLEFGSLIPKSGGTKNFLEKAFDKPRFMTSVVFGTYTVFTGFVITTSIVFGQYFLAIFNIQNDYWANYVGCIAVFVVALVHGLSVKHGIYIQNLLGGLKLVIIAILCITSILVLFFPSVLQLSRDLQLPPLTQFPEGSHMVTASTITAAFIQAFFCFAGWSSVHNVTSEIINPTRTLKIAGTVSLLISFLCYSLMVAAYVKVLSFQEIAKSGSLLGAIFFKKVYGDVIGGKFITFTIAISSLSNMFVVVFGIGRMNQEIFRHAYLPFSNIFVKNWPTNAPLCSTLLAATISAFWLVLTAGDSNAYNYLVSMEGYSNQLILLLVTIALYVYKRKNPTRIPEIKSSLVGNVLLVVLSLYLLLSPIFSTDSAPTNSLQGFPAYYVSSLVIIGLCFLYWVGKFIMSPKICGYILFPEIDVLDDGLIVQKWCKLYKSDLLLIDEEQPITNQLNSGVEAV
ncbi:hypothetical protein ACO0RG_003656 [Hanseniaspora osmophila]